MEEIVIRLGKGQTFEGISARHQRKLISLTMAAMGKKGGGRSTPAKREAALKREAKKRGE